MTSSVFSVENSVSIERKLQRNELDLGFIGEDVETSNLLVRQLALDEIFCFCGPTHPLATRKRLRPENLNAELWIIREKGSATRKLFESVLSGRNPASWTRSSKASSCSGSRASTLR